MPYHTIQMKPCTPPAKKPRLFRVAYLSLIWFATTICALLFTAYPANAGHVMLNQPADLHYTEGTAITSLELPPATGDIIGRLLYTLTRPPAGLTFDPITHTLSGTPTEVGVTTLNYEAFDHGADHGTVKSFTVTVSYGLMLDTPDDQNYTQGTAIPALQLPEATTASTAPLTYTLTGPGGGALPRGLDFDAGTRTLSGTPSRPGTTTLTYEVTDNTGTLSGRSLDFTVTVIVSDGLALTAPDNQDYRRGVVIHGGLNLPAATGGTGTLTYTLRGPGGGALPAGLSFGTRTRRLSGTPTEVGVTTLTYRVMDASGASANATFTVSVYDPLSLPTPVNQHYTRGTAISNLILPEADRAALGGR